MLQDWWPTFRFSYWKKTVESERIKTKMYELWKVYPMANVMFKTKLLIYFVNVWVPNYSLLLMRWRPLISLRFYGLFWKKLISYIFIYENKWNFFKSPFSDHLPFYPRFSVSFFAFLTLRFISFHLSSFYPVSLKISYLPKKKQEKKMSSLFSLHFNPFARLILFTSRHFNRALRVVKRRPARTVIKNYGT